MTRQRWPALPRFEPPGICFPDSDYGAGGNAIDAGVAAGIALDVLQTDRVNFAVHGGADPRRPAYGLGW